MSDKHGRKKIALFGNMMDLISASLMLVSKSLNFTLFLIFMLGIGMGGRVFVGYIFMTENMRVKDASKVTSAMFTIDSFCIMIAAMYFMHISKDWIYIFGISQFLQCIALIMMSQEEDSPKFYFGKGDYEKTR